MGLAFLPKKGFMQEALALARQAAAAGEVPVGAVVVKGGQVIGRGRNRRESAKTALAHAELEAIHQACQALGTWRLSGCQLVYGPDDERAGCAGTAADVLSLPCGPRPEVYRGFCEEECRALLQGFFRGLRQKP